MIKILAACVLLASTLAGPTRAFADPKKDGSATVQDSKVQLGPRPFYLVEDMEDGLLKSKLQSCSTGPFKRTDFSIGHRGAALQFPEHTEESYRAAAVQGAGIIECDVTFTKDRQLVCRHSQCDLHTTTNILTTPLADKCTAPFTPYDETGPTNASATCCTSDITLAEYRTLCGKMDASNPKALTPEQFLGGTAAWRTDLYSTCGTLMTHAESIELIKGLGGKFTPELKSPSVPMPFEGTYSQEDYAQQMIDEYKAAGINPKDVWPQSFNLNDVLYWIQNEPSFGNQAVFLESRGETPAGALDPVGYQNAVDGMDDLVDQGVQVIAPPMWMLVEVNAYGKIVPSLYAKAAKAAGLKIITWTIERSGPLVTGGGYYYQTTNGLTGGTPVIDNDGDMMVVLDVLAKDVGIIGIFSDWPATVTYYANCMNLK